MDKSDLIQLTNHLYQVTLLFPKKESLRYKMRELADEILAKWVRSDPQHPHWPRLNPKQNLILEDLEILDSFFEVAKTQNWVKSSKLLFLQQQYQNLKDQFQSQAPKEEQIEESIEQVKKESLINERQQKILEILKEKGQSQVWEVQKVFPNVSKRTLRRDFRALLKQGIIERRGKRNTTFYQIKEVAF